MELQGRVSGAVGCLCQLPPRLRAQPSPQAPAQALQPHHRPAQDPSRQPSRHQVADGGCAAAGRRQLRPPQAFYDKWFNADSPEKTRKQYQKQVTLAAGCWLHSCDCAEPRQDPQSDSLVGCMRCLGRRRASGVSCAHR